MNCSLRFLILASRTLAVLALMLGLSRFAQAQTWTTIAAPSTDGMPAWNQAVYDSVADRLTYFGPSWTWELSFATNPPTWTRHTTIGTGPDQVPAYVFDSVGRRVLGLPNDSNLDELPTLNLATRQWSSPAVAGGLQRSAGKIALDASRSRLLLHGGQSASGTIYLLQDVWQLSLTPPYSWTRIVAPSTPHSYIDAMQVLYDPFGDRLIADGMLGTPHSCFCQNFGSFRTLDPVSLTWTSHPLTHPPLGGQGFLHQLALDPVGGRAFAGYSRVTEPGSEFVGWVAGLSSSPTWEPLPAGPFIPPPHDSYIGLTFDSRRNRLIVVGLGGPWFLQFDPVAAPGLECPPDRVWSPGSVDTLRYVVTNPRSSAATAEFRWTSERDWNTGTQLFPRIQLEPLTAGETRVVALPVQVPDTVAAGANRISARVLWTDLPGAVTSCSSRLGDLATPVHLSLVESEVMDGLVRLTWYGGDISGGSSRVERGTTGLDWVDVGAAISTGDGRFTFEESTSGLAGTVYYRLVWTGSEGPVRSSAAAVEVPGVRFSLRAASPVTAGRLVRIAYSLPGPGDATVELVSVAGRRAGSWRIEAGDPRGGELDLRSSEALRPGVYAVRLTHAGSRAHSKVVVLR